LQIYKSAEIEKFPMLHKPVTDLENASYWFYTYSSMHYFSCYIKVLQIQLLLLR